jgi:hypothetical protein
VQAVLHLLGLRHGDDVKREHACAWPGHADASSPPSTTSHPRTAAQKSATRRGSTASMHTQEMRAGMATILASRQDRTGMGPRSAGEPDSPPESGALSEAAQERFHFDGDLPPRECPQTPPECVPESQQHGVPTRRLRDGYLTDSRHFRLLRLARPITSSAHSASDQPGSFVCAIPTGMAHTLSPWDPSSVHRAWSTGATPSRALGPTEGVIPRLPISIQSLRLLRSTGWMPFRRLSGKRSSGWAPAHTARPSVYQL